MNTYFIAVLRGNKPIMTFGVSEPQDPHEAFNQELDLLIQTVHRNRILKYTVRCHRISKPSEVIMVAHVKWDDDQHRVVVDFEKEYNHGDELDEPNVDHSETHQGREDQGREGVGPGASS